MSISEPFIRRPVGTSLLAIGLFVLGVVAYRFLPVAAIPRVDNPMISVSANLPGADPAALERFLTERLAEDWLYQSIIRPELQAAKAEGDDLETLKVQLDRRLAELWAQYFPNHPAEFETYFPWDRLFEAGILLK